MKISHILKATIFQFRVDMFLRPNNEKITSDFIMCVCVYSKYIHLQNSSKTNDFLFLISRLFVLLNRTTWTFSRTTRCLWNTNAPVHRKKKSKLPGFFKNQSRSNFQAETLGLVLLWKNYIYTRNGSWWACIAALLLTEYELLANILTRK